jgi:NAD(P)-dependent dehydrogenase (short-subunit alcohol dehydrogenase family)
MNSLIIGGNRGIGFELCKQLNARGDNVVTTCRQASPELKSLDVTTIENIDVSMADDILNMKNALGDQTFDLIIHNAGILSKESLDNMNFEQIERQFQVNTMGPLRAIHALQQNMAAGTKIGLLSSRMGSLADNGSGGMYGYRISKAGVNALGVSLAKDLEERNISVALLHPGLVATEMTGRNGIEPAQAAQGLIERMDHLTLESSGKFWHAEGYELPW